MSSDQATPSDSSTIGALRVYVHLAYGFDARRWEQRWNSGELVGINERKPYGYYRAEHEGCEVEHSEDAPENAATKFFRLAVRGLSGFDLVHAWRNRERMQRADVVWTHTESQHLGVLAVLRARGTARARRPAVIAQCVWLFDQPMFGWTPRRRLYRWLMERADIISVLSPDNLRVARALFPNTRTEFVRFGISTDGMDKVAEHSSTGPLRVLAVGNDRHRDWRTLAKAVAGDERYLLRIVSQTAPARVVAGAQNVSIVRPANNTELNELYAWADVAAVPLKKNLHASGITAVEEALVRGLPVVATDTGGLRSYFDDSEVTYAALNSPGAMREALDDVLRHRTAAIDRTRRARRKMTEGDVNSAAYVRWHVLRSREIVSTRA